MQIDQLDDLPSARELRAMSLDQFEKVQEKMRPQRITIAAPRQRIDWQALSALRKLLDDAMAKRRGDLYKPMAAAVPAAPAAPVPAPAK